MADTTREAVEAPTATDDATQEPGEGGAGDERLAFRGPIQQLLTRPEIGALIGVLAVWLLFWLAAGSFGTVGGTANYLDVAAVLGIMAVPVALLMIGGEFDLSSGSMTGATAIVVLLLSKEIGEFGGAGLTLHLAVPLALAFALLIGWFNGTVVEKTSLPSFIVTLGTFFILIGGKLGMAKLFTDKVIVEGLDEADGYDFWNNIFGATWVRNTHVWDGRDWAWAILLIAGGVTLLLGVFELSFRRRARANAAALPILLAGVSGGLLGLILLLTTGGSSSDWLFGAVTGAGFLLGTAGWCLWRYDRAPITGGGPDPATIQLVAAGVAAIVVAVILAAAIDPFDQSDLGYLGGSAGRAIFFIGLAAMGALALAAANGMVSPTVPVIGAAIAAVPAVSFLVTVQAARALLFIGFGLAGVLALASAARRARASSTLLSFGISMLNAVAIAGVALFIQSEGSSRKIRVELTTSVLLVGLVAAAMALATLLSTSRVTTAPHAHLGEWTRYAGIAAGIGVLVSLVCEFADIGPGILNAHDENGVVYTFVAGMAKGAIVGLAVYAVGVLYHVFGTDDEGVGRPLITVGVAAIGLGLAAKFLFVTSVEALDPAVTRFRVGVLYYLLLAAAGTWMLARTQFGSWTFAVGGNKDASRSVGVPAARTKTTLFMMVSVCAFITGMVIAFRLNSVQSNVGDGNEFRYIIVAVVGGNLLTGGYGSVAGAALGALIWGMISQGIGFAGWNTDWRFLVLGFLLLVAVIVNNFVRNRAEKMVS